jgi:hypothetical protein
LQDRSRSGLLGQWVHDFESIAEISTSVGHCLARAKPLPDHTHDRSHIVKSLVMGIIASGRKVRQVEYKYLVALKPASIRLLGWVDIAQAGRTVRYGSR